MQFEDFGNRNAFRIPHEIQTPRMLFQRRHSKARRRCVSPVCTRRCGLLPNARLASQTILFLGAGEAGLGIADLLVAAMVAEGLSHDEARRRCWFVDSKGLVVKTRRDLTEHKVPYAHDHEPVPDLLSAVQALKPTVLIGVSGQPQTFTRPVVEAIAALNERPIVFALSNPTSRTECTAEQAYGWSRGRAIFASGSPFSPVDREATRLVPGQANNAYIFPGVALGVIVSGARRVSDAMFFTAARTLAAAVSEADLAQGSVFPGLDRVRDISISIATAVADLAFDTGLATESRPDDVRALVEQQMYDPAYESYV